MSWLSASTYSCGGDGARSRLGGDASPSLSSLLPSSASPSLAAAFLDLPDLPSLTSLLCLLVFLDLDLDAAAAPAALALLVSLMVVFGLGTLWKNLRMPFSERNCTSVSSSVGAGDSEDSDDRSERSDRSERLSSDMVGAVVRTQRVCFDGVSARSAGLLGHGFRSRSSCHVASRLVTSVTSVCQQVC